MPLRIATGLSIDPDPVFGAREAAAAAAAGLDGAPADLVILFAAGAHLAAPEETLECVHAVLVPEQLVGCGAAGVLGGGREVERGTAVAVWAASLLEGNATSFHARIEELDDGAALTGMPDLAGAAGGIILADPASFPTDPVLRFLTDAVPGVPLLGGLCSARGPDGSANLFLGLDVLESGAVGVRFDGVELLPCVSQGATPVGPELTITGVDGGLITELAGRPALTKVRETLAGLTPEERRLVASGLLLGIVIHPDKPDFEQGDFLVRPLVGADPETGAIAVGADVRPGQVVRLQARDAASADRDLREALAIRCEALGGRPPAGALVFSCNGRGRGMFGTAHHDAAAVQRELAGAPAAGFFAAGEIGPVSGESFLHAFTATVAIFA